MQNNKINLWDEKIPEYDPKLSDERPSITPYLIESDKPAPAVIVFPGGSYMKRAEHETEPVALWLNSIGISSFVLNYRIKPYKFPIPLVDAKRAIRLVRFNAESLNIDENRIAVLGFSAGAHLASTLCTHLEHDPYRSNDRIDQKSSRPDAMVLCYPVISFFEFSHEESVINLLGDKPAEDQRKFLSNQYHVTSDTPPAFLWHTADDEVVPVENSLMFAQALRKNKIPFELHVFPSGRHGLGIKDEVPEIKIWVKLCENWLRSIGF